MKKRILFGFIGIIAIIPVITLLFLWLAVPHSQQIKRNISVTNQASYYKKLDEASKAFISKNVFEVNYTLPSQNPSLIENVFGTSWSLYHDDTSWYLMTNYHVVDQIVECSGLNYPGIAGVAGELPFLSQTEVNYGNFSLNPYDYNNLNSGKPVNFIPSPYSNSANGSMILTSVNLVNPDNQNALYAQFQIKKATIIYDRYCEGENPLKWKYNPNNVNLFANIDEKTSKQYQVDMALIKVDYSDIIDFSVSNPSNSAKEWIQSTYSYDPNDPKNSYDPNNVAQVFSINNLANYNYYLAGYPFDTQNKKINFADFLFGQETKTHFIPSNSDVIWSNVGDIPSSFANCWESDTKFLNVSSFPIKNSDNKDYVPWPLFGGASGSPLFQVEFNPDSQEYTINQSAPVAIFWGGTTESVGPNQGNSLFIPSVILFNAQSNTQSYNIWTNIYNYLHPNLNKLS